MSIYYGNENRKFTSKPWGWEESIGTLGKKIFIKRGYQTSWHRSILKSKIILVEKGRLAIWHGPDPTSYSARLTVLEDGDSLEINAGIYNRLISNADSYITEFHDYYDSDGSDITRYDPVSGMEIK